MTRRPTALVERDGNGNVAMCPDVEVASDGDSVAEARSNLEEALRRDLLEMARLDRSVRAELVASGTLFDVGYEPRMARIHQRNAQRLWRIIESVGWPGTDLVGSDGAEAAWLILQHAISEPDLLRLALPLLTTAAREGKADPAHAAKLEDRIRFFEGRPQRYGTQLDWDADGNLSPGEVDDPQQLAERRDAVGLPTLEEQIAAARTRATAEGERPPPDYEAYADTRNDWASRAGWRLRGRERPVTTREPVRRGGVQHGLERGLEQEMERGRAEGGRSWGVRRLEEQ